MSMMGIKGMYYLNEVWDLAKSIGCECKDDDYFDYFAQDCLEQLGANIVIRKSLLNIKWTCWNPVSL